MLYYEKTDIPEGIDVNKTSGSKECIISHHWYYLDNIQMLKHNKIKTEKNITSFNYRLLFLFQLSRKIFMKMGKVPFK